MGRMDRRTALITGAGRGQGRAFALTLAGEGADVVIFDCPGEIDGVPYGLSSAAELAEVAAQVEALGRRAIVVEGDVRAQGDLDRAVERGIAELGKIDVCVANAGVASLGPFWQMSEEEWEATIQTDLNGVWRTAKAVTPHMIEREEGTMVLISSVSGVEGAPGLSHYTAAKHGVLGLMKSICLELGPRYGIRCNAVLPGPVDTDIIKWQGILDFMAGGEGLGSLDQLDEGCKAWGALRDVGLLPVESTAAAVLFLCSDESRHVNGVELTVDAGHRVLAGLNTEAMAAQAAAAGRPPHGRG